MKQLFTRTVTGIVVCTALFTACSVDKTDFRKSAEKTIVEQFDKQLKQKVTAACAEPGSTKIGTTFECTATAADGVQVKFSAAITKENEVTVTLQP